jgi:hypothetical protein
MKLLPLSLVLCSFLFATGCFHPSASDQNIYDLDLDISEMANTTKFQEGIVVESYRNDSIDISLLTSAKDQDEITDLVSRGIVNRQKGAETKLFITKKGKELAKDLLHVKQHKLNVFRPIEPPQ